MLIFIVHVLIDLNLLIMNFYIDFIIILSFTIVLSWSFILKDLIYSVYE